MRIYNKYIISLVLASALVNALLAFLGQRDLSYYFIFNALAYLVITLFYAYFNPRARNALNAIGLTLFAGFLVVASLKVLQIVLGK